MGSPDLMYIARHAWTDMRSQHMKVKVIDSFFVLEMLFKSTLVWSCCCMIWIFLSMPRWLSSGFKRGVSVLDFLGHLLDVNCWRTFFGTKNVRSGRGLKIIEKCGWHSWSVTLSDTQKLDWWLLNARVYKNSALAKNSAMSYVTTLSVLIAVALVHITSANTQSRDAWGHSSPSSSHFNPNELITVLTKWTSTRGLTVCAYEYNHGHKILIVGTLT